MLFREVCEVILQQSTKLLIVHVGGWPTLDILLPIIIERHTTLPIKKIVLIVDVKSLYAVFGSNSHR